MRKEIIFWTVFQRSKNLECTITAQNQNVTLWSGVCQMKIVMWKPKLSWLFLRAPRACYLLTFRGQRTISAVYYCKLLREAKISNRGQQFQSAMRKWFMKNSRKSSMENAWTSALWSRLVALWLQLVWATEGGTAMGGILERHSGGGIRVQLAT